jgi:hypothetical protein
VHTEDYTYLYCYYNNTVIFLAIYPSEPALHFSHDSQAASSLHWGGMVKWAGPSEACGWVW